MKNSRASGQICVRQGIPTHLNGAAGTRVHCLGGTIWISVASQIDDIFLQAGEDYLISANGLSLIEGINGDSRIALESAPLSGRVNRWVYDLANRLNMLRKRTVRVSRTNPAA